MFPVPETLFVKARVGPGWFHPLRPRLGKLRLGVRSQRGQGLTGGLPLTLNKMTSRLPPHAKQFSTICIPINTLKAPLTPTSFQLRKVRPGPGYLLVFVSPSIDCVSVATRSEAHSCNLHSGRGVGPQRFRQPAPLCLPPFPPSPFPSLAETLL